MKLLLPLLLSIPLFLHAQTEVPASSPVTLTDDQMANIMKQLDQIEQTINKNRSDAFSTALSQFKIAVASDKAAIDLYQSCVKLVNFERKDLKGSDFQTWKDRNEGMLKDPDFVAGLRLQLEYLIMSLQAQQVEDVSNLLPALQSYLSKAIAAIQNTTKHSASGAVQRGAGRLVDVLNKPVSNSIFSQAYQLQNQFANPDWEYSPLAIGSIYGKIILPSYLENKPSEFATQWDNRISAEINLRKAQQSETEFQVYYKENYPQLQWAKAQSLFTNNLNTMQALADMLKIIRENPTHPKAGDWLKDIREAVMKVQPGGESPSFSEIPATTPTSEVN